MITNIRSEALSLYADMDVIASKLADLADKTDPHDRKCVLDGDTLATAAQLVTRARMIIRPVAGLP